MSAIKAGFMVEAAHRRPERYFPPAVLFSYLILSLPETRATPSAKRAMAPTIVWIHGLGDSGSGWAHIKSELRLPGVEYILPDAPSNPVTCNGGVRCAHHARQHLPRLPAYDARRARQNAFMDGPGEDPGGDGRHE